INFADRDYFIDVIRTGRPAISRPLLARTSGEPAVIMAVPVRNLGGTLVGVVGVGLNLLRPGVLGELRKAKVGETGYFVLRTRGDDPVYIVHPDTKLLLQPVPRAPATDRPAGVAALGNESAPVIARHSLRNANWDLEVVMPPAEAFAPLHRTQERMRAQTLLMALVIAALIWLTTFWMLRPLSRLHAAVSRPRHVNGKLVLPPLPVDEIGEVADAFAAVVEGLQQREAVLQAVHDASPLGLYHCGLDGRVTYASDAYFRIQGLARERMADGWQDLLSDAERPAVVAAWQKDLSNPVELEARIRVARPGAAAPLLLTVRRAPVLLNGELVGHVGTIEDVTEAVSHKRAQRQLTAVFDTTTDYIAQTDPTGRFTYLNRAARERWGLALDADIGHLRIDDFFPADVVARITSEIMPTVLAQGVWSGETVGLDSRGCEVPLSHLMIAHKDKSGRVERFSGVMRDISAQKAASADLARSEQTLRSIAEALPSHVAVIERDETCRYVNSAFGQWFGRTPESIVGQTLREVLGEVEYRRSADYVQRALAGEAVVFEKVYDDRDPPQVKEFTCIPLRTATFDSDGFVLIANDMTARKRHEAELREQALRDPLTGLLNRAGFDAAIARLTSGHGSAAGASLSVLYIDLDHFKSVNDSHGHAAGDELLKAFASRIQGCVRPTDPVCRLGGDEFAVLLTSLDAKAQAERVAAQVVEAAAASYEFGGLSISIGASVGVAVSSGDQSARQLIATADAMLYAAKREGRGRHVVA
ncbi:MAG: diguanylate cyclase, partial [Caldimonas sp.]